MDENLQPIQIKITTSGTDEAVKSINSVTAALKKLQSISKDVSNVMTNFGNTINKTTNNFKYNPVTKNDNRLITEFIDKSKVINKTTSKISQSSDNASKNIKGFATSLGKVGITFWSVNKAAKVLRQAMDESASWVENLNVMEVAFGNLSTSAYEFTKSVSQGLGLDANEMLQYVSLFQQMASAMGQATDTAYKMSTALTLLGTDVASLYNKDVKVTMEALRSAIAGQVKPVRQFGFDITSYSIDALIEEMGIANYTSRMMTQSQKQLARTILLIKQSKNAWGDLAKTLNTYSNQQKILQAQFTNLKRAIGDLFVGTAENAGIATRMLYVFNGVIMAIVETIRAFIPEKTSSGLNDIGDSAKQTTEDFEDLENQLNNSLASFDKFNTLSSGQNKGNDYITSLLEQTLDEEYQKYLSAWNSRMEQLSSKAHDIRDSIMSWLGFTKETVTYTDEYGQELTKVQFTLGEGYTTLEKLKNIIIAIIGTKLGLTIIDWTSAIYKWVVAMKTAEGATKALALAQNTLRVGGIFLLIYSLTTLISNWKDLDGYQKMVYISLTALSSAMIVFSLMSNKQMIGAILSLIIKFGSLQKAILSCTAALGALSILALGIATLMDNWADMSGWQRVITVLGAIAAAAMTAALAIGVFHATWTMGIGAAAIAAGIALVIGSLASVKSNAKSISTFANGGYPDRGQMFIANENGAELVGNIGGRTAVANNDMITQAIEEAAYNGMVRAVVSSNGTNNINLKIDANSNDLSRALARSMAIELQRQGYNLKR